MSCRQFSQEHEQAVAHARQLMSVVMAIDKIGRSAHLSNEEIVLGSYLEQNLIGANSIQQAAPGERTVAVRSSKQRGNRGRRRHKGNLGKGEVQADVNRLIQVSDGRSCQR